jgi:tRNA pseudouridine55 synthase
VNGIVVVDKPEGPTSFDVVARLRRVFKTKSIGHCGTLDPLATGVLVVAVGSYTRLVRVLTADDKRYTATIAFGTSTTTDDREGDVVARVDPSNLTVEMLRAVLPRFTGALKQRPPAYSAIHVDGKRAHELARAGEAVDLAERDVVVRSIDVVAFEGARAIVDVRCGKGTYIRALARDIGDALGVPAHLAALRRTESGAYTLSDAVGLDDDVAIALRSGPAAIRGVPLVPVDDDTAKALGQGKRPPTSATFAGTGLAHVGDRLVALVHVDAGALVVERGF